MHIMFCCLIKLYISFTHLLFLFFHINTQQRIEKEIHSIIFRQKQSLTGFCYIATILQQFNPIMASIQLQRWQCSNLYIRKKNSHFSQENFYCRSFSFNHFAPDHIYWNQKWLLNYMPNPIVAAPANSIIPTKKKKKEKKTQNENKIILRVY